MVEMVRRRQTQMRQEVEGKLNLIYLQTKSTDKTEYQKPQPVKQGIRVK